METEKISALDDALKKVDDTFLRTGEIRDELIVKMREVVGKMTIAPGEESPKMTEQKLMAVNVLRDLLKDVESGSVTVAKTRMQKKETESSDAVRQLALEMLKSINTKTAVANETVSVPTNISDMIGERLAKEKVIIGDGELSENQTMDN